MHAMGREDIYPVRMAKVGCHCSAVATDLGHLVGSLYNIQYRTVHGYLILEADY